MLELTLAIASLGDGGFLRHPPEGVRGRQQNCEIGFHAQRSGSPTPRLQRRACNRDGIAGFGAAGLFGVRFIQQAVSRPAKYLRDHQRSRTANRAAKPGRAAHADNARKGAPGASAGKSLERVKTPAQAKETNRTCRPQQDGASHSAEASRRRNLLLCRASDASREMWAALQISGRAPTAIAPKSPYLNHAEHPA